MTIDEAITAVRTAAARVEACQEEVAAAKQALQRSALKALVAVEGDEERDLIRTLYWDVPELPVKALEAAVGSVSRVRELAGPGPLLGSCERCQTPLHATSRTALASGAAQCKPCEREERKERQEREARWHAGRLGPWADLPLAGLPPFADEPPNDPPPAWPDELDPRDPGW